MEGTRKYFFHKMVVEYVGFIQLGNCDGDSQVINRWFLLTVPVSLSIKPVMRIMVIINLGRYCPDAPTNSQNSDAKRDEGQ